MLTFPSYALVLLLNFWSTIAARPQSPLINEVFEQYAHDDGPYECRRTKVAILGAGMAGMTAAQTLHNRSISDFVIIERNDYVGGRLRSAQFGLSPSGVPYTVELGANWVDGTESANGENPIWTLAKKYRLKYVEQSFEGLRTYDEEGESDYARVFEEYQTARERLSVLAAELNESGTDIRIKAALQNVGWIAKDQYKSTVEWLMDAPREGTDIDVLSTVCQIFDCNGVDPNDKYGGTSNFIVDQRGFSTLLVNEASTFLSPDDHRLLLNTTVTKINYNDSSVTITNADGSCISADYAICTFSIGVLQNRVVAFQPPLPTEKQRAIDFMEMGVYTKIFLQFNESFWPTDTQYLLYADPSQQGYFPLHMPLNLPSMLPDSNILLVTVAGREARRIERQSDEETKEEIMAVLRSMYPNLTVPEPLHIMYPRWGLWESFFGSYTSYPVGFTREMHNTLAANVNRLWFAGEGVSRNSNGYLHSAYISGKDVGGNVTELLQG